MIPYYHHIIYDIPYSSTTYLILSNIYYYATRCRAGYPQWRVSIYEGEHFGELRAEF